MVTLSIEVYRRGNLVDHQFSEVVAHELGNVDPPFIIQTICSLDKCQKFWQ